MVNIIMDRTGCPNSLWVMCSLYVVYLLNHLANPALNWRTPIEACYGITPDISPLLLFTFFQQIYYLDSEIPFPNSKEKLGRFVGIAENVEDALTFWIWTEDTEKLIARSVIRSAEDPTTPNKHVDELTGDPPAITKHVIGTKDLLPDGTLPIMDPDQLIGYTFPTQHAGTTQRVEVLAKEGDKYHIEYADGNEDHLTYEELINLLNKEAEDGYHLWTFKEILDHHIRKKGKTSWMEVKVLWDTGEEGWEP